MFDPFDEIRKMHEEMDRLFRNFWNNNKLNDFRNLREPLTEIKQSDEEVIVEIELPGVEKEDIILTVTNDLLEVRAKKESKSEVRKKGFFKQEKSFSGYYRKIALPAEVKGEEAESEFKNSVLIVRIPKSKQKISRKIKIK